MTLVIILNVVFAIAVVAGVLRLLGWAIVSSSPDQPQPAQPRRPAPRPVAPRPQSAPARRAAGPAPSHKREPVAG